MSATMNTVESITGILRTRSAMPPLMMAGAQAANVSRKKKSTTPGVKRRGMEFALCLSLSSRSAGAKGHGIEGRSVGFVRTPRGATSASGSVVQD